MLGLMMVVEREREREREKKNFFNIDDEWYHAFSVVFVCF